MGKVKAKALVTNEQLADLLSVHDKWEKGRYKQDNIRHGQEGERIAALERAIIQINHFTESIEGLGLIAWKAEVSSDLRWLKYLVGGGTSAGAILAIVELIKLFKGG